MIRLLRFLVIANIGPLFEELLYRERMLDALASVDVPRGIRWIVTSLLFAIPHIQPWSILGTFLVGLALAFTYESTRCLGFCVALHVGLNLASMIPPQTAWGTLLALLSPAAFASGLRMARRIPIGMADAVAPA
ncbi:MAG: CPBP family intramembrane metalloprotease [bacterium]|nr:CPBP family intramembrane metalloprotease [bacterium]